MSGRKIDWDAEQYEGSHSFVWRYGEDLLAMLEARMGERILDVGSGTGHLTAKIADSGAQTLGIDSSPAMVAQARQNYPNVKFQLCEASAFRGDAPFDAVFSNAALHWMLEPQPVADAIARALKPGGRFVAEMGAKGNIALIDAAIDSDTRNYYPSIPQYSAVLEQAGFEVTFANIFERPTPLEGGEGGLRAWIATFRPDNRRPAGEVENELRATLFRDGRWVADYRRLRMVARKVR